MASLFVEIISRKYLTFHLTVRGKSCTYFATLEAVIFMFMKDLKMKLCKHNQESLNQCTT